MQMRIAMSLLLILAASTGSAAEPSLFAVTYSKGSAWVDAKKPSEQSGFAEHSANLKRLREAGTIVLGARYGDVGLIVMRAADAAEVERELAPDASLAAKTFAVKIEAFRPFYGGCVELTAAAANR
jgi:hypothetical protein